MWGRVMGNLIFKPNFKKNHKIGFLFINSKITKFFLNFKITYKEFIKALSVVCSKGHFCATDRGLQFSRNWFKNKVPHHPAPHM